MTEEQYQTQLKELRRDWSEVIIVPETPGVIQASYDRTAGILAGCRAALIAEIINRALRGEYDQR